MEEKATWSVKGKGPEMRVRGEMKKKTSLKPTPIFPG